MVGIGVLDGLKVGVIEGVLLGVVVAGNGEAVILGLIVGVFGTVTLAEIYEVGERGGVATKFSAILVTAGFVLIGIKFSLGDGFLMKTLYNE